MPTTKNPLTNVILILQILNKEQLQITIEIAQEYLKNLEELNQ